MNGLASRWVKALPLSVPVWPSTPPTTPPSTPPSTASSDGASTSGGFSRGSALGMERSTITGRRFSSGFFSDFLPLAGGGSATVTVGGGGGLSTLGAGVVGWVGWANSTRGARDPDTTNSSAYSESSAGLASWEWFFWALTQAPINTRVAGRERRSMRTPLVAKRAGPSFNE